MGGFQQLGILLWKNSVIKRRHCGVTCCELLLPGFFLLILALIRSRISKDDIPDMFYVGKTVTLNQYSSFDTQNLANNCATLGQKFLVAPGTAGGSEIGNDFATYLQGYASDFSSVISFMSSAAAMDSYVTDAAYGLASNPRVCGGIVFTSSANNQWDYSLRFNTSQRADRSVPLTTLNVDIIDRAAQLKNQDQYINSGFIPMQAAADAFILSRSGASLQQVQVMPFPTPKYKSDSFFSYIATALPIFMVIAFLLPVSRLISGIVLEKESKIREGMRMMGLRDFAFYGSWYITYAIIFLIVAIVLTIVSSVGKVFSNSNPAIIFFYFWLFGLASLAYCFFISVFFSRGKTASTVGVLCFFASFFVFFAVSGDFPHNDKMASSLLPPTAFAHCAAVLGNLEQALIGVTSYSINTEVDNFSFANGISMLVLDFVLYTVLGWYFDHVIPSEFGTSLKPWFFLTPQYWCGDRSMDYDTMHDVDENQNSHRVEPVGENLRQLDAANRCVKIKGLRKEFTTGLGHTKVAVQGLNLSMYEGQIFALLGHNGAGKTTTISMLTGLLNPSAGDATVFGQSIRHHMPDIRKSLGVCPQHDVLFPDLTVREHLWLYAAFKGMKRADIKQAIEQKIADVGLTEKRDVLSKNLSGGMKRKLSVAIALIGDSKLVILDEPTSGMDPFSRRSTWNILKNNKEGRVIILTTHFMDEADILGDRIAIMGDGDLKCCGSALFLKTHFGVGYCLTMVKDNNCVSDQVQQLVAKYVPDNKVLSDVGAEISFQLPIAASNSFADMFNELEARKAEVRILSYGISVTTLEEVFLKIARGEEGVKESSAIIQSLQKKRSSKMVEMTSVVQVQPAPGSVLQSHQSLQVVKGRKVRPLAHDVDKDYSVANHDPGNMFFKHMRALVKKRYIYSKRDWKALFYELIIPVIVLIAGLGLLKNLASQSRPSLTFGLTNYNPGLQNLLPYDNTIAVSNSIVGSIPSTVGLIQPIDMSSNHTLEYLAQWLLDSHLANKASRYGAYMFNEAASSPSTLNVTIAHNTTGYHSLPTFLNIITDSYLKYKTGDSSASIRTSSMPWPRTNFEQQVSQSFSAFAAATIIMIAYCFIPAAVVAYIVRERETNVKHQHFISGVSANAYWLSHYVWDVVKYMCPFLLSLLVIYLFDIGEYVAGDAFGALTLLFFLFGTSMVSFTYLGSYLFKHYSGAQNATLMLNFVAGLILMLVAFVLRIIPDTSSIANEVVNAFRILPAFCLGDGLANLALRSVYANVAGNAANPKGIFHWDVTSGSIAFMAAESLLYLLLVLAIEHILLHPRFRGTDLSGMCMGDSGAMTRLLDQQLESEHSRNDEDEDVKAERLRVNQLSTTDAVVRVANLKKVYPGSPPKFAVKQLSFAIPNGECFALLGINGAGKTSAFRILTGEYAPTYGEASIGGQDILTDLSGARRLIGYCPQFDALLDLLTAREHLELYANVKGIPSSKIPAFVEQKLEEMNLMEYADRKAGTYSGGNKRKLSVAVAMIGNPPVVFLDEPSTGMDPVSRRFMWDVISRISTERKQSSVILTTHSMEEAEALCSRIGIMVGGTFRCLGSAQHLKNKFGQGYELDIKTQNPTDEQMGPFYDHIRRFIHDDCIAKAQLQNVCESLGRPDRFQRIAERGTGAFIYAQLRKDDRVNARIFLEWWIIEDFAQNVEAFVLQNFAGAVCLEHHASFSRFRLPQTNFNLAQVFGILNSHKDALFVSEYSLSQTTLEQIFNSFAAQQEEEKLEVAGMFFQHNPDRGAHQA